MTETRQEIGELWRQVNRRIHDRCRHAFRGSDLPLMCLVLLREIGQEQGVTVSELGRRSGTVKSHVSKMVDQLVQQGYLEKRPDPDDQRLSRLYLTPSTMAAMADMEHRVTSIWKAIMAKVPDHQVDEVAGALRILLAALDRAGNKQGVE